MPVSAPYKYILLLLIGVLCACASTPEREQVPLADASQRIYFIYENWHTSILIEADALLGYSATLREDFHDQRFLRIGWGDGDFFTGKSKRWTTATKALLASSYSALQVLAYRGDALAEIDQQTIVPLAITEQGLRDLAAFIGTSIARDEDGRAVHLSPVKPNSNIFYLATPHYSVFSNCNTWSSHALQQAGLPVASRFHLTAQSVFSQARRISELQTENHVFASFP